MNRKKEKRSFSGLLAAVLAVVVLLGFTTALRNLTEGSSDQGREQLETALRRSAVACYAAEGIYPDDIAYLQEHYGIQINEERYTVIYTVFASNLMPDITVVEK